MGKLGDVRVFGVMGDPVDHSLSPAMHNAAFAASGLPHLYLRYRVPRPELGEALAEARRLAMGGINLTVPLKETALALVDSLTPEAERIGAVNTIRFERGALVGDNTDAAGFLRALAGRVDLVDADVVVIGAGGSARAIGTALATTGCRTMTIANRTVARAEGLADRLGAAGGPRIAAAGLEALGSPALLANVRLIVNTTSAGLGDDAIPIRHAATARTCLFMDLVYGARPTAFLRAAARARRRVLDGTGMLLHQGALAFEAWTGRPAPLAAMAGALSAAGLHVPSGRRTTSRS